MLKANGIACLQQRLGPWTFKTFAPGAESLRTWGVRPCDSGPKHSEPLRPVLFTCTLRWRHNPKYPQRLSLPCQTRCKPPSPNFSESPEFPTSRLPNPPLSESPGLQNPTAPHTQAPSRPRAQHPLATSKLRPNSQTPKRPNSQTSALAKSPTVADHTLSTRSHN